MADTPKPLNETGWQRAGRYALTAWGWSLGHPVLWHCIAATLCWGLAVSRLGYWPWVPALPPLWLLGWLLWERRGRLRLLYPTPGR